LDPLWVSYHNNTARWIIFDNLHLLTSEEEADYTIQFSDNVRALVMLLHNLLIGPASSSPEVVLPDEIREVLAHYSNPNESVTADKLVRSLRQANRMLGGHNEVKYRLGAKSDVGRIRKLNEDSMVHHDLTSLFEGLNMSVVIASVADGVGGHAAGDIASQLTVSTIESYIDELPEDIRLTHIPEAREWIIKAANAANEKVYQERKAAGNNMACTLVLAFFTGDMATILNVGDSRAYLLNKRGIRQITTDHSLVERLVSIGEITREEARHHPRKSVIYRVIGDRLNLDYDIFDQTFVPGEALLICSDGLTDMVEDATIWRIWRAASSPQEATEQLVAEANTAGGTDNITVIIVEIAP
jgi:serine/threonine protein phosphatase PrpC